MNQYLAGFFDADGSITLVRHKPNETRRLCIALTNTDSFTLSKITEYLNSQGIKSHTINYTKQKQHYLQASDIRIYGGEAEKFMNLICDYFLNQKKSLRWRLYQERYKPLKKANGKYSKEQRAILELVANEFLSLK